MSDADLLGSPAGTDGAPDVVYRIIDSPVGPLLLAATDSGLVRVVFEREGFQTKLERLAATIGPRVVEMPTRLETAASQLGEYFAGSRQEFDLDLDQSLSAGFRLAVHRYLPRIGYGQTRSYKQVAEMVGNSRLVRAVGAACAANPLPIVVPCHRVVRSDGHLGGYLGGLEAKRTLLELERQFRAA